MEKASCWKARQKASRRRRRNRSMVRPSLGPEGAGRNEGSGPGSSIGNRSRFACMDIRKRAKRAIYSPARNAGDSRESPRFFGDENLSPQNDIQKVSGANEFAPDGSFGLAYSAASSSVSPS